MSNKKISTQLVAIEIFAASVPCISKQDPANQEKTKVATTTPAEIKKSEPTQKVVAKNQQTSSPTKTQKKSTTVAAKTTPQKTMPTQKVASAKKVTSPSKSK